MSSNGSVREPSEHAEISSVDRDELHTDGNALFADAGEAATPAAQPSSAFAGDAYDEHHDHRAPAGHSVNAHIPAASAVAAPPVRQLTAEEAVEARIAAARLRMSEARGARSASGGSASAAVPAPFYVGDARPLTPRTGDAAPRPKVLKAYGYPAAPPPAAAAETAPLPASSAEPPRAASESETAATTAAAAAAAEEPHSAAEEERSASAAAGEAEAEAVAALRVRNRALEAENDVLRVRQSEATAAVLSAQHRHEANLVKLRDKQARQGQLLQDKDARIAELTASVAALGDAAQAGKASEEQLKALQQKLQRKDTMLAEMRLALDRYAADKRKADAASEDKRAQHAKVLQRIDAGRRKHSRSKPLDGDAEVEAILADVDLSALPEASAEAVYRLVGVVASCRAEVSRLRVVRTSSPAAGAFSRMSVAESGGGGGGGAPLRTSSPIAVRRGGSPMRTTPRELEKEGPKGEAAWQLWADKKKRQAAAAAAAGSVPDHATPWRGGGLNRRPAQRAPSPLTRGRVVPGQEAPPPQPQQQQPHSHALPAQQAQPQPQHRSVPHVSYKMTPAADTPQDKVLPTPQEAPPLTPGTAEEPPQPPPSQQQQQPLEQPHTGEGAEEAQQQASEEGEADHIDMDAGEPRVQARAHQYAAPPPGLLALVSSSRRVQQHVACED